MLNSTSVPRIYYAATAVFLLLDYAFDVNLRLAFLEPWPGWRAVYYAICFSCLWLIIWRPNLTLLVTTIESLTTLSALLLSTGARVLSPSVNVLETGNGFVTVEEIINFIIVGGAAWLAWWRGSQALHKEIHRR